MTFRFVAMTSLLVLVASQQTCPEDEFCPADEEVSPSLNLLQVRAHAISVPSVGAHASDMVQGNEFETAPAQKHMGKENKMAPAEKSVGKGKIQGADVCSAITLPNDCSCTMVDQYTSKLSCSKTLQGPTGSNTFTLVADIKPCLGPPTIVLTASEANTGHSFTKTITPSGTSLGVSVPGLSLSVGVAAVGTKLIASFNDLGNDRFSISFALDGCMSVGPWWSPFELCGSKLTSKLPERIYDSPKVDFYQTCAGKTADDGAAVEIWNRQLNNAGTGSCLVTSAATGYVYAEGCSNQGSVWIWTAEYAIKTKTSGACNGNLNQKWDWKHSTITNRATGMCLSFQWSATISSTIDIVMQTCTAKGDQHWVWSVV